MLRKKSSVWTIKTTQLAIKCYSYLNTALNDLYSKQQILSAVRNEGFHLRERLVFRDVLIYAYNFTYTISHGNLLNITDIFIYCFSIGYEQLLINALK